MPASGHRDHTTSPSALAPFVIGHLLRPWIGDLVGRHKANNKQAGYILWGVSGFRLPELDKQFMVR